MRNKQSKFQRLLILLILDIFFGLISSSVFYNGTITVRELVGAALGILTGLLLGLFSDLGAGSASHTDSGQSRYPGFFIVALGISALSAASFIFGKDIVNFVVWVCAVGITTFLMYATIHILLHRSQS